MIKRVSTGVAAATLMALTLLAGCGSSTAPEGSSAAPVAAPSTTAAATPNPSTKPSDETENVQAASGTFVKSALTLGYTDDASDYAARVKPLMTKQGYNNLIAALPVDEALTTQKKRFGERVRSTPRLVGKVEVKALSDAKATAAVTFESQIQQRSGSSWKVIKKSIDDTVNLELVRENGAWLVDDLD